MNKIDFTLKTPDGNVEFEVVKLEGKFYIFHKYIDFHGKKKSLRIGQTSTWPDVINMARIFTSKPVLEMEKSAVR